MQIAVNNRIFDIPFDLSAITLSQYINYYNAFGKELDAGLESILRRDYRKELSKAGFTHITEDDIEMHRNIDLDNHIDTEALAWFSFWTEHDFNQVKDYPFITPLLAQYRIFRMLLDSQTEETELLKEVEWMGSVWEIQDYKVTPASEMSFNEIITSKEVLRQSHSLGKGKWESLPYLCAIFLRKKGEEFDDIMVQDGGERMELMQQLPMSIALQVAFFLNCCVSIWRSISASSEEVEEAATVK